MLLTAVLPLPLGAVVARVALPTLDEHHRWPLGVTQLFELRPQRAAIRPAQARLRTRGRRRRRLSQRHRQQVVAVRMCQCAA